MNGPAELERALEATLFAAEEPLSVEALSGHLGDAPVGDVREALKRLAAHYEPRGVHLVERGDFEAVNSWYVGLNGGDCIRAAVLTQPSRIVIDLQH